ncbi:naringenin 3-dioxygenase [Magnaporthiopsis poae ATCC 64411]|uniref:Naringenin 3-dioxygenase n=1 Tax=Magnaporthiopsis poae (strain ATCC 64411 / 73-15) TaxID=644358 RepID=A0A0C4DT14_MAGP6|nr:naringenin 3-dioxygenase [Magnaporthiopsis poae ATCC 64411]
MSFTSIPVLDLSQAESAETKPAFLSELRSALMEVGFLYLKNVGIPDELFTEVIKEGKAFFDIPMEEKLKIEMKNAPSFLGYSRLSAEITAGAVDHREQIDLSTEHAVPGPDQPAYYNLLAPNQWPSPSLLPRFRPAFTEYMARMGAVSMRFTSLVAEAIGLPATAFDRYFERNTADQQHKLKVVKYPDAGELGASSSPSSPRQGVGPHKDSMYTSYLLQASAHRGLQVQNLRGAWVDCPPLPGTLVVAIGQGLEALTAGATLRNRVKSHPDVGERWYPEILASIREEQRLSKNHGASTSTAPGAEALRTASGGAGKTTVEAH